MYFNIEVSKISLFTLTLSAKLKKLPCGLQLAKISLCSTLAWPSLPDVSTEMKIPNRPLQQCKSEGLNDLGSPEGPSCTDILFLRISL